MTDPEKIKKQIEICILAGGLSLRMGRDKSKLRLGGKTLLGQIRRTAKTLRLPVRTLRRDLVPRCGPLGGIYTALKTTTAESILFLACDMPGVSGALLKALLRRSENGSKSVFISANGIAGFPFLLQRGDLPTVENLLAAKQFSLQALARKTRAKKFRPGRVFQSELLNVNTPADWIELKNVFAKKN